MTQKPDHGALEAARHGIGRSSHWPSVEKAFRVAHPTCIACGSDIGIQVHHVNPFHYVIALGRPDLELDPRNLVSLCEDEEGKKSEDHHLLLGHLGDFKEGNLAVREDAAGPYHGMAKDAIRADLDWQNEEHTGRLKPLDLMTNAEKVAFKARLDAELPPDPELLAHYRL